MTSTWTQDEELRLQAIENALTILWNLLHGSVSKEQFNRLNIIRQDEVSDLTTRIEAVETLVSSLQTEVDALL